VRAPGRACLAVTGALCLTLLGGCGSASSSAGTSNPPSHRQLVHYVAEIEPIRLGVNRLLDRADPILDALHRHRISSVVAADRLGALERRFAAFTVDIAAVQPQGSQLRSLHAGYAQTYVLEDAYLSALVSGIATNNPEDLPQTQPAQRAAIIRWRTGLAVLARRVRARLPADLQQAGRGEIAPSG
jgi:hypothetical protein